MTLSVSSEQHLRLVELWHELGKIVAAPDNEARAKAGYERYRTARVGSAHLAHPWESLRGDIRDAWVAAFTE